MRLSSDLVEGLALLVIAVGITAGGRALLAELHMFEIPAFVLLGLTVIALIASMRRVDSRLAITVRAAYLTGVLLAIVAVIFPARWSFGSSIAMIDIAIVFDLFARFAHSS
ncbi:MAG TPA: hypothetical protein VMD07_01735 [Candidatus Acidoferrales bacterium]|nr:hypothetical protein [Candidatus Acidoferrales bacterium]